MPSLVRDWPREHQQRMAARMCDTDCPLIGCNDRYVGTRANGLAYLERHLRVWHGLPLGEVLALMVNA